MNNASKKLLGLTPFLFAVPGADPIPMVLVANEQMPQVVQEPQEKNQSVTHKALLHCEDLQACFKLSQTTMAKWLGISRRSLYNWKEEPKKTKRHQNIENRIVNLIALKQEMELEHWPLLEAVAFSPIYGDTEFGQLILNGGKIEYMIAFYDRLFGNFEHYRKVKQSRET